MPQDDQMEAPGFEFPLEWRGKIIALDLESVAASLDAALAECGFAERVTRGQASARGRYVTYNVTVLLVDRAAMHRLTAALAGVAGVKLVL